MTGEVAHLVLERLRAIRSEMAEVEQAVPGLAPFLAHILGRPQEAGARVGRFEMR